ncbi:MAG: Polysaccharide deacetylase [Candidatus Magasanikbacteria bacterium GW2011_GWA2_41_55]|uniref:Polysaccharide deacetylase n=1 Tax=Candidatus Magasanikbacteria bacterium GW2011_GWA2_41_55 TaxID=1619038 RepID=A0A0G0WLP7_9BACT|nr:MAG: Polysaccharide deacetylase [Candidatus Magasanikbacteria bacterium GW2011_GWA2_41_55]
MKNLIKKITGYTLLQIRNLLNIFVNFKEVSVLCFHGIDNTSNVTSLSPAVFASLVNYLVKNKYYFARLDEIMDEIDGKIDLPKKTVAITFDDGYESFLNQALPILKSLNIPTTLFIITDFEAGGCLGRERALLKGDCLKEMLNSGLISLQFHSKTHGNLMKLNRNDLKKEIISGKTELENKLNIKLSYFAYPGGGYTGEAVDLVKEAGFEAAFSIKPGTIHRGTYRFLIRRNVILSNMSFWEFKLRLTKAIDWYRSLSLKFKY